MLDLEEEAADTSSSSSTPEVTLDSSTKYTTRRRAADSPQNSKYTHAESPQLDELDSVAMRRIREDGSAVSSSGAGVATDSIFSAIYFYKGSKAHSSCELN